MTWNEFFDYTWWDLARDLGQAIPVWPIAAGLAVLILWIVGTYAAQMIHDWNVRRREGLNAAEILDDVWTRSTPPPEGIGEPAVYRGQKGTWTKEGPLRWRFLPGKLN